ncbi:hypothetical protein Dimus_000773 [Dionaea muscipula]
MAKRYQKKNHFSILRVIGIANQIAQAAKRGQSVPKYELLQQTYPSGPLAIPLNLRSEMEKVKSWNARERWSRSRIRGARMAGEGDNPDRVS